MNDLPSHKPLATGFSAPSHITQAPLQPQAPTPSATGPTLIDPSQAPTSGVKLAPLPCGLVLFDDPRDLGEGTAYLPNTPIQRIRSPNDLRNDALWIGNVWATEDRIKDHPNLRSGYYFRVFLNDIAQDLGIQSSSDSQMAAEDAMTMATIMTRTMTIAARLYGWDTSQSGPHMIQEPFLMRDIARSLPSPHAPDARFRDDLVRALTQSHQEASQPDWAASYEPDSVFVTLRFNRLNYVQQMLSCPLPSGKGWVCIDGVQMSQNTLEYCLTRPTLVKATVEWDNASSDIAALAAFGQAGKRRNTMRLWMAQPELAWLSQYAKVSISMIWVDESGFQPLSQNARLPYLLSSHPESSLSYSAGLVAMNHWQALASCTWSKRTKLEESNVWACWLRSLDRAMMFSMALKAYEAGFHVDRYGAGALKLRVPRRRLMELAQFKELHGFTYPDLSSLANTTLQ